MKLALVWGVILALVELAPGATPNYKVVAHRLSNQPIVSALAGSAFDFNYNAAIFVQDGKIGLAVRCQNLTDPTKPWAVGPSYLSVSNITFTNGVPAATPTTKTTWAANGFERSGTEDPRITYKNGVYYLFYTAYNGTNALLSSAWTRTPFDVTSWKRIDPQFDLPARNWSKSGAALFADSSNGLTTDYLFWGDSSYPVGGIGIARGVPGQWGWADSNDYLLQTRPGKFDSNLVESGPTPLKLKTGDFLFIYNSAQNTTVSVKPQWWLQYNIGFAILDQSDPTKVVQRSDTPIMSPQLDWEVGNTTAYLTPNVVFLEGLIPDPNGCQYADFSDMGPEYIANAECFFGVYGGADSVLGAVQIIVSTPGDISLSTPAPITPMVVSANDWTTTVVTTQATSPGIGGGSTPDGASTTPSSAEKLTLGFIPLIVSVFVIFS